MLSYSCLVALEQDKILLDKLTLVISVNKILWTESYPGFMYILYAGPCAKKQNCISNYARVYQPAIIGTACQSMLYLINNFLLDYLVALDRRASLSCPDRYVAAPCVWTGARACRVYRPARAAGRLRRARCQMSSLRL